MAKAPSHPFRSRQFRLSYVQLRDRLYRGEAVILDGGTGTELESRGVPMSESAWCGLACLSHAETVIGVHRDYIDAGARIITANTFASSRLMLNQAGMGDRLDEIVGAALDCAKRARDDAKATPGVVIAGSLSHMVPLAVGTDRVANDASDEELLTDVFGELAQSLKRHDADMILLEMMYHPIRARIAMAAACATGLPVWCGFSARRGSDGNVLSFSRHSEIDFGDLVALLDEFEIEAAGPMHSAVDVCGDALKMIGGAFDGPLFAYPDSGYLAMPHWQFVDTITPENLVTYGREWYRRGARVIGGCCGLGVSHIKALAEADLIH